MNHIQDSIDKFDTNKPSPIQTPIGHALKMNAAFSVQTQRGILKGRPGDYIIKQKDGKIFIIEENTFKERYEIVRI